MLLLKRKGRGGRYVVPNAVMALLKTNESAPTSPSALFMGAEPIRAHLRAQPRLESESARALAEVARAAQCNYSSGDQRSEPPPRGTIADSRYKPIGSARKEYFAEQFRFAVGCPLDAPLDPFDLRIEGVQTVFLNQVPELPVETLHLLLSVYHRAWSAITLPTNADESSWLIILNPTHTRERQHATLMEEICHILLGHLLTSISHVEGQSFRDYNRAQEADAYGLGEAILVPRKPLIQRVHESQTAEKIASDFRVSTELVQYRIKITGAWYRYKLSQHVKLHKP